MLLKSPTSYFTILLIIGQLCEAGFLAKLVSVQSVNDFKWYKRFPYADLVIIRRFVNMYLRPGRPGGKTSGENERTVCQKIVAELKKHKGGLRLNVDRADFTYPNWDDFFDEFNPGDVDLYLPGVSNWEPEGPLKKFSRRQLKVDPNYIAFVSYLWKYQPMKCKIIFRNRATLEFFIAEGPQETPRSTGYFILIDRENKKTANKMELFLVDYVLLYSKDKRGKSLGKKAKKVVVNLENLVGYVPSREFWTDEQIEKMFGPMRPTKPITECGEAVFKTRRRNKFLAHPSRSDQIVGISSDAFEEIRQSNLQRYDSSHRGNARPYSCMSEVSVSSKPLANPPHDFHSKMADNSTSRKFQPRAGISSLSLPRNRNIRDFSRTIGSRYSEEFSPDTPQVDTPRPGSPKSKKTFASYAIAVTFAMKLGILMTRRINGQKHSPKREK